jgi:DNA repair exonuclease SbcCD ATPase subunit
LQAHAKAINIQISALHTGHDQLNSNVSGLHEFARTVMDGVTTISNEQAGVHEALRENTQALTGNTHIVEQQQKNLQEEINNVAETGQQIVATTTTMANEQIAFHETVKANDEKLTNQTDQMRRTAQNLEKMQIDIRELQQTNRMLFHTLTALANVQETLKKEMQPNGNQTVPPWPPIPDLISQIQGSPAGLPTETGQGENNQEIQIQSKILPNVSESNPKGIG